MSNAQLRRNRFNRRGEVVEDTRQMSPQYLDPIGFRYVTGDPLFAEKRSSPARKKFQASNNRAAVQA